MAVRPIVLNNGELERMDPSEQIEGVPYTYVHTQSAPASVWTVTHNLGRKPSGMTVMDSAQDEVFGYHVVHITNNQLTLTFGAPFSGEARLI